MDVENSREESLLFFRSFIARNLKVPLQISCHCLLETIVLLSLKLIRFNAHFLFDVIFRHVSMCHFEFLFVSVIRIYGLCADF